MTNKELIKLYPIKDDIWPGRRWNLDHTDYVDLSGDEGNLFSNKDNLLGGEVNES